MEFGQMEEICEKRSTCVEEGKRGEWMEEDIYEIRVPRLSAYLYQLCTKKASAIWT